MTVRRADLLAFRRFCGCYRSCRRELPKLRMRERELRYRMEGVHAVSYTNVRGKNNTADRKLMYMERLERVQQEIRACENRMNAVSGLISSCPSEAGRVLLWQSCVEKVSIPKLAEMYGISERTVEKKIRAMIESVLAGGGGGMLQGNPPGN